MRGTGRQEDEAIGLPRAAEVVLPCTELRETLAFFTERLGFRVDAIAPADDPSIAVVSAYGLRVRLVRTDAGGAPGVLRLLCADPAAFADGATELVAPNGTRIEIAHADPPLVMPPAQPSFVITRANDCGWIEGRAGMRYADLVPDRQAGRLIASRIQIADAGPVPDYVHFHRVRFQMIYCVKGWVKVVYEDQGAPFVLHPGDCVLQAPEIRHRVLESSAGLEVLEIGSPAHHETCADHELALPTPELRPERLFGGQRFVRHQAARAAWRPADRKGFTSRDTSITDATSGLASVRVIRGEGSTARDVVELRAHDDELLFGFVLAGGVTLRCADRADAILGGGDAFVVPRAMKHALTAPTHDVELLELVMH